MLAEQPQARWLEVARARVLAGDAAGAGTILASARARFPFDTERWLAEAGIRGRLGDHAMARTLLREILVRQPGHAGAAFELARLLANAGQWRDAGKVLVDAFTRLPPGAGAAMRAAKMLAAWGNKPAAVAVTEAAITAGVADAPVLLYTAALQGQLGAFERARELYLAAIEGDPDMLAHGAAYGLATIGRYRDADHPDLARLMGWLAQPDLPPAARASLLFALGKAHDDLGDFATAAAILREANALVDRGDWSRRTWRRVMDARLGGRPLPVRVPAADEPIPVFIVGMPRSGTTLVAELLGRSPSIENRGELDWLPQLADELAAVAKPDRARLDRIAGEYLSRLRREDAATRWFIDKQPLNFLHVDLIRALFPQAAIIHCRRNSRDTALSIWSQHFGSTEYRFAYDFDDIAAVMQGCTRWMAKAARQRDVRMFELRYEALAREPQASIDTLADWLGVPRFDCSEARGAPGVIGTASLWQARQPVYTRSIGRWRAYAGCLPELLQFPDD